MWRSLVARTLGVGEAPSSNLGIPIMKDFRLKSRKSFNFYYVVGIPDGSSATFDTAANEKFSVHHPLFI